ncbi:MAG TPA: hypothetical protein VH814_22855 [Steroidobacteraceae bacterium]|jgi:hypothetical protein
MNILRTLAGCTLVLVAACGSDKEPTANNEQPAAATVPASGSPQAGTAATSEGAIGNWYESDVAATTPVSSTRERLADPDAVIDRYERECSGAKSPECHALRLDVEALFLESLLAVRSANDAVVDPRWYRLAAVSETAQLACIGLNELIWDPKRTAEDDAVILRAMESPYRSVRAVVLANASRIPAIGEWWKRSGGFDYRSLSGVCVEDARDPLHGAQWAGDYPGAQFRVFASNDSRRWFTTPDPVEKVIDWFAARGKPAHTAEQLMQDAQAKLMEEMTRLSENPEQDNTAKIMQLMAGQGSQARWSEPFRDMEGTGEIKYVMIADNQAVAVFRDDVLKATSIVAPRPPDAVNLTPDLEAAREEAEMRSIFGY